MRRVLRTPVGIVVGLLGAAMYAMPQATISARPGVVNYVEGHAYVNGKEISASKLKNTVALNPNDILTTDIGKAEVLLAPGAFLRIGDNSAVRMISPSLVSTQFEVEKGEAMIEVAQLPKDSNIQVLNHGGSMVISKDGVYRANADGQPAFAVLEGKADVQFDSRKAGLKKGHEVLLTADLRPRKFDPKKEDDLYAWSNSRSEYEAAATYASAKTAAASYGSGGYGLLSAGFGPGWYWYDPWNTWAWYPGSYAFSPFGWGFFAPGYIGYAPVVYGPGYYVTPVAKNGTAGGGSTSPGRTYPVQHYKHPMGPVPINPMHPPAVGASGLALRSPAALNSARSDAFRSGVASRAIAAAPASHGYASRGGYYSAPSASLGGAHMSAPSSMGGHASGGASGVGGHR